MVQWDDHIDDTIVIVSHELALGVFADLSVNTKIAIFHNIQSNNISRQGWLREIGGAWLFNRLEKYICKSASKIFVLSIGDRNLLSRLCKRDDIEILRPGCPIAAPVCVNPILSPELVITGTYKWGLKRRDLRAIRHQILDFCSGVIISNNPDVFRIVGAKEKIDYTSINWSSCVRIGIVSDSFASGFKLKALEYIANNCIVISRVSLELEFSEIEFWSDFIIYWPREVDLSNLLEEKNVVENFDLGKFNAFRDSVLSRFNWEKTLSPLTAYIKSRCETYDP